MTSVDESIEARERPESYVMRLAKCKAASGWDAARALSLGERTPGSSAAPTLRAASVAVLAADTAVVLDGNILVKPVDRADGERMLHALSGRTHEVLTAVAVATPAGVESRLSRSEVTFRTLAVPEVRAYWDTGEPKDKAGGYAIQGRAAVFIANLRGSYSGVMGLPLFETAELLELSGVPRWQ
jgi:septum formation protein